MKRLVASLLCISLIFTQYKQAEAAVPVVVAGVAAGAVLLLAAGAVQYYTNPGSASGVIAAAGQIYSNVQAYTSAFSALGQGYMLSQAAALQTSSASLLSAVKNSAEGAYSALKEALEKPQTSPDNPLNIPVGSTLSADTGNMKTTSPFQIGNPFSPYSSGTTTQSSFDTFGNKYWDSGTGKIYIHYKTNQSGTTIYYSTYWAHASATDEQPLKPLIDNPSEVPAALTGSPDGGSIPSAVMTDINNMIASGDLSASGVSVSGTTTGDAVTGDDRDKTLPPYVPPATLPGTSTPVYPTAAPPTTTTGLGTSTTTAAEQTVATTQQQVTAAENALAADPTNTALQADLAAAQAALAAAQAALNQAKAAENEVYINPTFPNRKTLNFESWRQLVNVLPTKFPFNLVTALGSYLEPFLAPAVPPSFELHIYQDKKLDIDLAVFDTPVAIFRWGLALLLTFGLVQFLIRWWKGTA